MQYSKENDLLEDNSEPTGPGQQLRQARLDHDLSVDTVAFELRLSPELIQDLEADSLSVKYKPTFVRGYLRAYAKLVGLNPTDVIEAYEALQAARTPIARSVLPTAPPSKPRKTPEKDRSLSVQAWLNTMMNTLANLPVPQLTRKAVVASVMILLTGVLILQFLPSKPGKLSKIPSIAAAEPDTGMVAGKTLATLEVDFQDNCWITVFDANHGRLVTGIRNAQTPLSVEGRPPFRVMLGNAKVAKLKFNGESVDLDIPVNDEIVNLTLG